MTDVIATNLSLMAFPWEVPDRCDPPPDPKLTQRSWWVNLTQGVVTATGLPVCPYAPKANYWGHRLKTRIDYRGEPFPSDPELIHRIAQEVDQDNNVVGIMAIRPDNFVTHPRTNDPVFLMFALYFQWGRRK